MRGNDKQCQIPSISMEFWHAILRANTYRNKNRNRMHWGSLAGGGRGLSSSAVSGFEFSCVRLSSPRCLTCLLGLQGVQWAVGLVVVRASWSRHPHKSKKKKRTGIECTEACGPAVETRFPYLYHLGSSLSVHACHPRSVLSVYWACRVFSRSGD
jgi:hypothetical protein